MLALCLIAFVNNWIKASAICMNVNVLLVGFLLLIFIIILYYHYYYSVLVISFSLFITSSYENDHQ